MQENFQSMNLGGHLGELRSRLLKSLACFIVITLGLLPFTHEIFSFLADPLYACLPEHTKLLAVGVVSPVMGPLKTVLFASFALSLPFFIYELWCFAAPGLYKKEKKIIIPLLLSTLCMFGSGIAYCYFVLFRFVFRFIAVFTPQDVSFAPDIDAYIGFCIHLFMAFGLAFELPVAVTLLSLSKLVSLEKLRKARRYVIVGIVAVAAVITPPDVTSQLLLAVPMIALYELGLLVVAFFNRHPHSQCAPC